MYVIYAFQHSASYMESVLCEYRAFLKVENRKVDKYINGVRENEKVGSLFV